MTDSEDEIIDCRKCNKILGDDYYTCIKCDKNFCIDHIIKTSGIIWTEDFEYKYMEYCICMDLH